MADASWDIQLAKMFVDRDNPSNIGCVVGKVISGMPNVKISILDDNIILTNDKLYICNSVINHSRTANIKLTASTESAEGHSHSINLNTNCNLDFNSYLSSGDLVLLVPSQDETKWFIIDKITKL